MTTTENKAEQSICNECGVLTVEWRQRTVVNRQLEDLLCKRDYYPVSFMIELKPDIATSYVVTPKLEELLKTLPFHRIRSVDGGKIKYAVDVALPKDGSIGHLLDSDERIENWNTASSAPVCERHVNFIDKRW